MCPRPPQKKEMIDDSYLKQQGQVLLYKTFRGFGLCWYLFVLTNHCPLILRENGSLHRHQVLPNDLFGCFIRDPSGVKTWPPFGEAGRLVNGQYMSYNLLINRVYWCYNPLTNHFPTSDIAGAWFTRRRAVDSGRFARSLPRKPRNLDVLHGAQPLEMATAISWWHGYP